MRSFSRLVLVGMESRYARAWVAVSSRTSVMDFLCSLNSWAARVKREPWHSEQVR